MDGGQSGWGVGAASKVARVCLVGLTAVGGERGGVFQHELGEGGSNVEACRQHVAEVRRAVPADRLVKYNVKEGWAPLCTMLGVEVAWRTLSVCKRRNEWGPATVFGAALEGVHVASDCRACVAVCQHCKRAVMEPCGCLFLSPL